MQEVGKTIVHYGKVEDKLPGQEFAFGGMEKGSMHVPDCLKLNNNQGFGAMLNEFKEEIYLSKKK